MALTIAFAAAAARTAVLAAEEATALAEAAVEAAAVAAEVAAVGHNNRSNRKNTGAVTRSGTGGGSPLGFTHRRKTCALLRFGTRGGSPLGSIAIPLLATSGRNENNHQ